MKYFLDTCTVSDFLKAAPRLEAALARIGPEDSLAVPVVVRGELAYGLELMAPGKRRDEFVSKIGAILDVVAIEPTPNEAADVYARVKADCKRRGVAMDENDLWIAASVIAAEGVLVTRDGDFQRIGGIQVEDWTAQAT